MGNTVLRWNGDPDTDEEIETVLVSQGTHPNGSVWAMNPIPRNDTAQTGPSFAPKCNETCTGCVGGGRLIVAYSDEESVFDDRSGWCVSDM